jgi:hypothetical protein
MMKKTILSLLFILPIVVYSQIPFGLQPSFETNPNGHYATGLGIADINNDGWKDIIIANGNDMQRQRLVVYYNRGDGTFNADPDWQSDDIDYHGHLSAGDINKDGYVDIAVSVYLGAGGFGHPGRVKIYFNQGGELEGTPSWVSEPLYSFSCALGDADGDGDLDLAVACGEPYNAIYERGRIFYNNNGSFNTTADWQSNIAMGAMDVAFGDVDRNGFPDLIFVCQETDNYVFLADDMGNIDDEWDWYSDHPDNYMNSVDFGRVHNASFPCFVTTGNDQLGGDGKIKQFTFVPPIPQHSVPSWESNHVGYGSGILIAEVSGDEYNDLLYGSWWGPLTILTGVCDFWDPIPAYTALETSVVEAIMMSDLGQFNYQPHTATMKFIAKVGTIFLEHQQVERINGVWLNGVLIDKSEYCYTEMGNFISFKNHIMPGSMVVVEYDYMKHGDIVISNWDPGKGNFIYYNDNNPVGIAEASAGQTALEIRSLAPVPAREYITLSYYCGGLSEPSVHIYNMLGERVLYRELGAVQGAGRERIGLEGMPGGQYSLSLHAGNSSRQTRFIIAP